MRNLISVISAISISAASATVLDITVAPFGGTSGDSNGLAGSTGSALTSSNVSIYIGTFNEAALSTATSVGSLFSAFTSFGQVVGIADFGNGFLTGTVSNDVASFNGQQVYAFVANNTNVNAATEALVWKYTGQNFVESGNPTSNAPTYVEITNAAGTTLLGSYDAGTDTLRTAAPNAVPEPSATLLFAGSLTLLGVRRRRA